MHDDAFDQMSREGVRNVPRRGFLGLAAGLAAIAMGGPAVDARRRKRKKCKNGTTKCGKKCFNLKTDSTNCGACGTACPAGQVCGNGVCGCPADQSFINGACIPRFGCTLDLDTCTFGKKLCPESTNESDAKCFVSSDGQPFCARDQTCDAIAAGELCPPIGGFARILIPCDGLCTQPGETGSCVRPISQVRP